MRVSGKGRYFFEISVRVTVGERVRVTVKAYEGSRSPQRC